MPRNQIGVIGYGNIGSKIVDFLLREQIQPVIVVRNPDQAQALEDDYYPAQLNSDIRPIREGKSLWCRLRIRGE